MAQRNKVEHHGVLGEMPSGKKLYASVPMELARDKELSPSTSRVALYIWSHGEDWDQSAKDVAENLGMDRGAVARALVDLQVHGWLIREIVTRPGKEKPAGEKWHLQMSNTRFTPEFIAEIGGPESPGTLRLKAAPSTDTLRLKAATPCCSIQHPPAAKCRTIVVQPVVHAVHTTNSSESESVALGSKVNSGVADAPREVESVVSPVGNVAGSKEGHPKKNEDVHNDLVEPLGSDPGKPEGSAPWSAADDAAYAAALLAQDDQGPPRDPIEDVWTSEPLVAQQPF